MTRPAVLMTHPEHFAIRGGANPHTRNADNQLKVVDSKRALEQWTAYVEALVARGVDVCVAEATPELTGMVFAGNAGFLHGRLSDAPTGSKTFYPSHFTPHHRRGEGARFTEFMHHFGFSTADYPEILRFEGEADAFSIGRGEQLKWIFTYGFRTDPAIKGWLEKDVIGEPMISLRLTNPRYYHGDTLICDLGEACMAWLGGLDEVSGKGLREAFEGRLIELDDEDATAFVGNSFYVETTAERLLFASQTIPAGTRSRIEATGVEVIPVDISEFLDKGGGGAKCMVFNLGNIDSDEELSDAVRDFRARRRYS